jgi:hypothetical protein
MKNNFSMGFLGFRKKALRCISIKKNVSVSKYEYKYRLQYK